MVIEIINTGSELMLGRVLNTHQQWLCRQLSDAGYLVERQVAVADTSSTIEQAVRDALPRADLIITTGGLGPTSDDLTRDVIAALFGRSLREDTLVKEKIEGWFRSRNRPLVLSTLIQAQVPEGAVVLYNGHGTAPGLILEGSFPDAQGRPRTVRLAMLPGPPRELKPMFTQQLMPWIQQTFPLDAEYACRTLRSTAMGESMVQELIAPPLANLVREGLDVGYCARTGEVDIRLSKRGANAKKEVDEAIEIVRKLVSNHVFGEEEESLESVVVRLLREKRLKVATAESCTGGRLASRITDVPGASEVFVGGAVTYSNELKMDLLGVRSETLATHGAVSEAVVREMAEGARTRFRSDFALALTGIAGPAGGTADKPVGTVFMALASQAGTEVLKQLNTYDRETFKQVSSQQALEMLRRRLVSPA